MRENENGLSVEVAVERILLDMEEVGVYSKPRVSVYEDEAHQKQIADSERPEALIHLYLITSIQRTKASISWTYSMQDSIQIHSVF